MPSYATGPSSRVSRGPVVGAYAEGDAISRPCDNCGADSGSFCRRGDGTLKPAPCCTRLRDRHGDTPDGQNDAQRGAQASGTCTCSPSQYDGDDGWDRDCPSHGTAADLDNP